jgi:hypothetical protein
MNDDLVVSKILKLLENNTSFIGYALNGGIGTKINVRNTETGKTIQALSINVDSSGEVLVVKDSEDNLYKAVTFKTAEQVTERIIQIRKTKPVDDKKVVEYTDSDIEIFYLFVKLIDTGSPVPTNLTSTWIRKGSSCTQFVGAYERCNYGAKQTISGTSYTGLPYVPYTTLTNCLNDDLGRDAKTPHGSKDESGGNAAGWKYYSSRMTAENEQQMLTALISHDNQYNTNYKKLFGYGSILECSGAMYIQGWENAINSQTGQSFQYCEFSYLPGYTLDCTSAMQAAGYCDSRGFISSKCPLPGQEAPGMPSVGNVQNDWGHQYGWKDLPYEFMYKRHFQPLYLNGSHAKGTFLILEVNEDQTPNVPEYLYPWVPGCPSGDNGGPYNGTGGNRFPDGTPPIQKRDMKLSTHKAEIWLGSSKKTEAIKLHELGASDLFSGMYNAFILAADETRVDQSKRLNSSTPNTVEETLIHETFYKNWNKNIIDLRIDPRVWIYVINNIPRNDSDFLSNGGTYNPYNWSLQNMVYNLFNRTINLTVLDNKTQVIHLKLGLSPASTLSNTDCKGSVSGFGIATPANTFIPSQSWEYQKYITITVKNWKIEKQTNTLDISELPNEYWKKPYIGYKYFTFFGNVLYSGGTASSDGRNMPKDIAPAILLRPNNSISFTDLSSGNHFEQYNYTQLKNGSPNNYQLMSDYYLSTSHTAVPTDSNSNQRRVGRSTSSWWELWDKTHYDNVKKRFSTVVGYTKNYYQILTNFGLDPTLDYTSSAPNRREVTFDSYYCYLTNRPLIYIPSTIRSIKDRLVIPQFIDNPNSPYFPLVSREELKRIKGVSLATTRADTLWSRTINNSRTDGKNVNFISLPSSYYNIQEGSQTKSYFFWLSGYYNGPYVNRRFDTRSWENNLWVQFVYDGFIELDIESYKDVSWQLPTNPQKYIKFTILPSYSNSEYNFVYNTGEDMETVLSPGTQDIFKKVKFTKPNNVYLDPNTSFLVYMNPFCTVTKKKKEI